MSAEQHKHAHMDEQSSGTSKPVGGRSQNGQAGLGGAPQGGRRRSCAPSERTGNAAPVTCTINDQQVTVPGDVTILDAAQELGIHIPTLCYEPMLPPETACRICMVEVEGAGKMKPACATTVFDGMKVQTDTDRVRRLRKLYLELMLSDHDSFCTPPCQEACPTHIKIPEFLDFIASGDYPNAVRKLREDLPFPAVLGRVCTRPCQGPCRRRLVEQPIAICWLHRFAADQCLDAEKDGDLLLPWEQQPESGKRVAIVGAGPAGLAAAFYLRLDGHAVKIYEALPEPGGVLRYGIPEFHLPKAVLDREMDVVWRLGAELQCNVTLGKDLSLQDLLEEQGYDAVLVAVGASKSVELGIPGEGADGVVTALDFLVEHGKTGSVHVGRRVVAIGDGFGALDAVRTAVREGADDVSWYYQRTRQETPAHHTEVEMAEEEGARLEPLTAPVRILTDSENRVSGVEMVRMGLGEPDQSGRRRPVPIEGSQFVVECDQVVTAIGQSSEPESAVEEHHGTAPTEWMAVAANDMTLQTANPRIFASGHDVLGAQTVIQSIAQGKKAAWSIDAFLRGEDMTAITNKLAELRNTPFYHAITRRKAMDPRLARMAEVPPVFIDMTTDVSSPSPPPAMLRTPAAERVNTYQEVELGVSEEEARRGAELCLQCYCPASGSCDLQRYGIEYQVSTNRFHGGAAHDYPADFRHDFIMREPNRCINCGRCVRICREEVGASCYDTTGRGWDTIVSTPDNLPLQMIGCVSCGKCAETCPTGAIQINRRVLDSYELDESRCMFCGECVEVCPYDALEQTEEFELADFDRPRLARSRLYDRREVGATDGGSGAAAPGGERSTPAGGSTDDSRPAHAGGRRCPAKTTPDLVPHALAAMRGEGWVWQPLQDKPVDLDLPAAGEQPAPATEPGADANEPGRLGPSGLGDAPEGGED